MVVHVNGGFHSEYWDGTARQFALRRPDAAFKTVAIVPSSHPAVARVDGAPIADYVVFAESRAADVNDGRHSVNVSRSLDYELHLPANASADQPAPLLLWLSDDGLGIGDGMALWREDQMKVLYDSVIFGRVKWKVVGRREGRG